MAGCECNITVTSSDHMARQVASHYMQVSVTLQCVSDILVMACSSDSRWHYCLLSLRGFRLYVTFSTPMQSMNTKGPSVSGFFFILISLCMSAHLFLFASASHCWYQWSSNKHRQGDVKLCINNVWTVKRQLSSLLLRQKARRDGDRKLRRRLPRSPPGPSLFADSALIF